MLWYGSSNLKKFYRLHNKNNKKTLNLKMKNYQLFLNSKTNFNKVSYVFYVPFTWNMQVIKSFQNFPIKIEKSYIYLYTDIYYFYMPVPYYTQQLCYNHDIKTISFFFNFKTNNYALFWKKFNAVFSSFNLFFFKKLKFKGKGYYIFKNRRNTVALQFGYSHKIYIYMYFLFVKFVSKTTVLLFGINNKDLINKAFALFNTRSYNIFTSKGIRFAKQIIYKKTGKISSYR